ncbi:MAG: transglycosylase SLT domain-containing protein [Myxococcota bacterium]
MRAILLALPLLMALAAPARAAIYTYTDKDGVVHFTNTPPDSSAREYTPGADDLGFGGAPTGTKFANTPRMWEPPPKVAAKSRKFEALIARAAERYRLPAALIKAVMAAESGFNPRAKSHAGACGLMQLMPVTAAEMNVGDIFDPEQNVFGGARYLRYLINKFNGDVKLAVAAYNAGPNLVARLGRIPEIPETKKYVRTVLSLYRGYRRAELLAQGG